MSFKKAVQSAKLLQQVFEIEIPAVDGENFVGKFHVTTGKEGTWILRINPEQYSGSAYGFVLDLRTFVASLVALKEEEDLILPMEIIQTFFTEAELQNPSRIVHVNLQDSFTEMQYVEMWQNCLKCKTEADVEKLPTSTREFMWELLLRGFLITFDNDYLFLMLAHYNRGLEIVKPNLLVTQFFREASKLLKLRIEESAGEQPEAPQD
jgi:hypothetical protein